MNYRRSYRIRETWNHKERRYCFCSFNVACAAVKIVKRFDRYLFKCKWRSSGGAYGYVDMGGWIGGQQAEYDGTLCRFNLLKFPERQAMEKILDLTMLIFFQTGAAAGVKAGSVVYMCRASRSSVPQVVIIRCSYCNSR
jgi:hypothetical protein